MTKKKSERHLVSGQSNVGEGCILPTSMWSMVHQRSGCNIRRPPSSDSIMEAASQQSLALICNLKIRGDNGRLGRWNTTVDTVSTNELGGMYCINGTDHAHPCAMGVGKGASGSSDTRSHSLMLPSTSSGARQLNSGNLPAPSNVYSTPSCAFVSPQSGELTVIVGVG
jgi:hypothetical protein